MVAVLPAFRNQVFCKTFLVFLRYSRRALRFRIVRFLKVLGEWIQSLGIWSAGRFRWFRLFSLKAKRLVLILLQWGESFFENAGLLDGAIFKYTLLCGDDIFWDVSFDLVVEDFELWRGLCVGLRFGLDWFFPYDRGGASFHIK